MSDKPLMNLDRFVGEHVAVQLMQPMLMMVPSREEPPRPIPAIQDKQPIMMMHIEGVLTSGEPRSPTGFVYLERAKNIVGMIKTRVKLEDGAGERVEQLLYEAFLQAYNDGRANAGSDGTYRIKYLANDRYMETQLHPGAVFSVTRCTEETAPVRLHKPDSGLIVPG